MSIANLNKKYILFFIFYIKSKENISLPHNLYYAVKADKG